MNTTSMRPAGGASEGAPHGALARGAAVSAVEAAEAAIGKLARRAMSIRSMVYSAA